MKTFKNFSADVLKNMAWALVPIIALWVTSFGIDRETVPIWLILTGGAGIILLLEILIYIGRQDMPESMMWASALFIPAVPLMYCIGNPVFGALGYKHADIIAIGIGSLIFFAGLLLIYGVVKLVKFCIKKGRKKVLAALLGYLLAIAAGYLIFM